MSKSREKDLAKLALEKKIEDLYKKRKRRLSVGSLKNEVNERLLAEIVAEYSRKKAKDANESRPNIRRVGKSLPRAEELRAALKDIALGANSAQPTILGKGFLVVKNKRNKTVTIKIVGSQKRNNVSHPFEGLMGRMRSRASKTIRKVEPNDPWPNPKRK